MGRRFTAGGRFCLDGDGLPAADPMAPAVDLARAPTVAPPDFINLGGNDGLLQRRARERKGGPGSKRARASWRRRAPQSNSQQGFALT
jgi:hypothetical protein